MGNMIAGLLGLLGSAGGIGAAAYGGSLMKDIEPDDIRNLPEMLNLQGLIDNMGSKGEGLLDMFGKENQMQKQQIMGDSADAAANQMNLLQRLDPQGSSGLIKAQAEDTINTANQQGYQNFLKQFQANQNLGSNMLNTQLNAQQNFSENIAQSYINNIQSKNVQNASLWGGLSQGLLSFVPKFEFGG